MSRPKQAASSADSPQSAASSRLPAAVTQPLCAAGGAKPPPAAIRRMSLYLRELQRFDPAVLTVSSRDLAARLDVSADVVRHDLAMLGSVGRRGVGYEVTTLVAKLRAVLGSDTQWRVALVGAGSLGHALLRYQGFERLGFELVAALDIDPKRIGEQIGGVTIGDAADMETIFREYHPQLAILAVPADVAASVAIKIAQAGVTGILNFAPTSLKLPGEIGVINVDLASEMQRLAFHVSQRQRQPESADRRRRPADRGSEPSPSER
ncbi:MAG: redox-sensing transcriptional repressor Rex [Planctomycetaceae bacterium]